MNNERILHEKATAGLGDWAEPIPLTDEERRTAFPVEILAEPAQSMVRAVSEVNQVDPGLAGTILLSILSTCLAKRAVVDLRTHREPINIYVCSVLSSGERKSSTLSVMMRPIQDFQKETGRIITVDDVTPEKLGSLMTENGERMAILSTEGGIFDIMAGRYGKKLANLDLFLKSHAGDAWSCYRVGRPMEMMSSPALTMCLTVQPEVIKMLGSNEQLMGRGLVARFLYSLCEPQAGFRERHKNKMHNGLLKRYSGHIVNLLTLTDRERILRLTPQAQKLWDSFYNEVEAELRAGGKLYLFRDWGSKLAGAVARIAGLLHMAEYGESADQLPIRTNSVKGAIGIGSYFMEHAMAIFTLMGENPTIQSAKTILEYIRRNEVSLFKGRDVIRHTGLRTMAEVMPGIKVLIERCYLKEYSAERAGKGRPDGTTYVVNPNIH